MTPPPAVSSRPEARGLAPWPAALSLRKLWRQAKSQMQAVYLSGFFSLFLKFLTDGIYFFLVPFSTFPAQKGTICPCLACGHFRAPSGCLSFGSFSFPTSPAA